MHLNIHEMLIPVFLIIISAFCDLSKGGIIYIPPIFFNILMTNFIPIVTLCVLQEYALHDASLPESNNYLWFNRQDRAKH